jgi:hypothetical protein
LQLFSALYHFAHRGNQRLLDGHNATSVPLRSPAAVVIDSSGNIYIADKDDNRVRKVTPAGTISPFAGNGLPDTPAIAEKLRRQL